MNNFKYKCYILFYGLFYVVYLVLYAYLYFYSYRNRIGIIFLNEKFIASSVVSNEIYVCF